MSSKDLRKLLDDQVLSFLRDVAPGMLPEQRESNLERHSVSVLDPGK
jgi:hypothetical protein